MTASFSTFSDSRQVVERHRGPGREQREQARVVGVRSGARRAGGRPRGSRARARAGAAARTAPGPASTPGQRSSVPTRAVARRGRAISERIAVRSSSGRASSLGRARRRRRLGHRPPRAQREALACCRAAASSTARAVALGEHQRAAQHACRSARTRARPRRGRTARAAIRGSFSRASMRASLVDERTRSTTSIATPMPRRSSRVSGRGGGPSSAAEQSTASGRRKPTSPPTRSDPGRATLPPGQRQVAAGLETITTSARRPAPRRAPGRQRQLDPGPGPPLRRSRARLAGHFAPAGSPRRAFCTAPGARLSGRVCGTAPGDPQPGRAEHEACGARSPRTRRAASARSNSGPAPNSRIDAARYA